MPSKNVTKLYLENSYYHIYNRGVEKRDIFLDEQDYSVFLSYLKDYLLAKNEETLSLQLADPTTPRAVKDKIIKMIRMNNFAEGIRLIAYCLMPNHFHLFLKQKNAYSINKFIQSLLTRYTMYFNRRYERVGPLFQSVYKAVLITNENQFIYLSKYIHKQAIALQGLALQGLTLHNQPSSYPEYLGLKKTEWIHPEDVLIYFENKLTQCPEIISYKKFVEENYDMGPVDSFDLD